jgi:acetyl-CoA carboxylase, biotin carboxylase subunit
VGAGVSGGVRVDTHIRAGAAVPPYYDSLLAKVIARGADRDEALAVLADALDRCAIDGVATNLGMQRALITDPEFAAGGVGTGYLARRLAAGAARPGARETPGRGADERKPGRTEQAGSVRDDPDFGLDLQRWPREE